MWKDVLPIGPVLFLLVVSVLERVTPNYDWRRNYVSELALKKYGWMQRMNLVIYGVWLVILSLVLAQKSQAGGWLWGIMAGAVTIGAGIWNTNAQGEALTLPGKIHNWMYRIGTLATGGVLLVVGWEFKSHPAIWAWSWGVAVFNLLWWTLAPRLGVKLGIAQRMVIYTTTVWLTIMAAWIMWR